MINIIWYNKKRC